MNSPSKKEIEGAVKWLDGKGADAFQAALDAGGMLAEDCVRVCAAVDGLLSAGLTRRAVVLLLEDVTPFAANGSRISADTIERVLQGLGKLQEHLLPGRKQELEFNNEHVKPVLEAVRDLSVDEQKRVSVFIAELKGGKRR